MTVRADEQLKGVLPVPPTAQRTFPQNDELALFAEIYDDGRAPEHKVDIVTTVRSDTGTVLFMNEDERASNELQGQRGGYGYTARIPLSDLPPGLYVLRVEARSRLGDHTAAAPRGALHGDGAHAMRAAGLDVGGAGAQGVSPLRGWKKATSSNMDDARQV